MARPALPVGDHVLAAALQRSVFKDLPPELLERVLTGAIRLDIPAGSVLYRQDDPPRCGLLVSGLLRVFLVATDGRQVMIRYMTQGSVSGSSRLVLDAPASVRVQAVTDVIGLVFDIDNLRSLAQCDARVAWTIAVDVARSQEEIMRGFAARAFDSLRQRRVRHLLDLAASRINMGQPLVAALTQQQLADAVGSSREAIARVLRDLRDAGLADTGRRGVVLLDPGRLHDESERV